MAHDDTHRAGFDRRMFLGSVATAGAGLALAGRVPAQVVKDSAAPSSIAPGPVSKRIALRVNDKPHELVVDTRTTLLDALRDHLQLTGTKKACDRGQCGACTVIVDARRINACLALAVMFDGAQVVTVEGLAHGSELSAVQAAFVDCDGLQCGYCTPGQVCSATAMIDELRRGDLSSASFEAPQNRPVFSAAEIRERMSGNICRCGAYPNIVAAIKQAAGQG